MKQYYFQLLCLFLSVSLYAQNIPEVKLKDNSTLKLVNLNVEVNITGNVALTTYKMKFYNGSDTVLEGELAFPLGQGQSVTDFAMDVNGSMRHAAIVEKELGRVAYESTIRKTIDPGLLEMTKGNNYKARVYPIPAKGYKEIEITYEQTLVANNEKHSYQIPLNFENKLSHFSIEINAFGKKNIQIIDPSIYNDLKFRNALGVKKAHFKAENFTPRNTITLEMRLEDEANLTTYNDYFNFYKSFKPKSRLKAKPKAITVFWDASYSMERRKLDKEFELLDAYIQYLENVKLNVVVFNTKIRSNNTYNIKKGNWNAVKKALENVVYDGGTSYVDLENYIAETNLLFTDGMFNLGDFKPTNHGAIYAINSLTSANHSRLSQLANTSQANYVNLSNVEVKQAIKTITRENYKFLGVAKNENVYEVYPLKNTIVNEDFALSGRFKANTTIELLFGYNNDVTDKVEVNIETLENSPTVKRLWAKQKLDYLNENSEENKDKIIQLALKNHLITAYTSMIILDRVEDYARYKIEPPTELKARYKELVKQEEANEADRLKHIESRKHDLLSEYKDLMRWYGKDFSKNIKDIKKPRQERTGTNTTPSQHNGAPGANSNTSNSSFTRVIDSTRRIISGYVTSVSGEPLPGVNIYVKNDVFAAVTDFDGKYMINAEFGSILVYSYIGFLTEEVTLGSNFVVNVALKEDTSSLDEVVVIGYGVQRRTHVTGAVTAVSSESIENENIVVEALQGRVAGLNMESKRASNNSDDASIRIHGLNFNDSENAPLYVVDGIVYSEEDFKDISAKNIDNIRVLKDGAGSSIYGSRASNGVILISTKSGILENKEKIEALNRKIDEEIVFKPWSPKAEYLVNLSKSETPEIAYNAYLKLRETYKNTPTFFMDIAEYFDSINQKELAVQIVTNLIEIDLDNHELSRALAYKLQYFKEDALAVYVYQEILKLRPEEPHSYRDLALAYEAVGEYQKAFDILFRIVNGELLEKDEDERFYGIEHIAYVEACHLVSQHGDQLDLTENHRDLLKIFDVDIRVVIDWNHNDTDLDLWVENPNDEKVLYSNKTSKDGGRLSEDMTEGYGPEEFMIKKASKGDYEILVDYYADQVQKISGPTTLKVTIFTNYGRKNEKKEIRILRLNKKEDEIEVGTVSM